MLSRDKIEKVIEKVVLIMALPVIIPIGPMAELEDGLKYFSH